MCYDNYGEEKMEYKIKYCTSFFSRLMGAMFKRKKLDFILCFPKVNSVHTFFCFQNLDIVMTDKDKNILYIYKNFKPWKIILPKKNVYYTLEYPANTFNLKINQKIDF